MSDNKLNLTDVEKQYLERKINTDITRSTNSDVGDATDRGLITRDALRKLKIKLGLTK